LRPQGHKRCGAKVSDPEGNKVGDPRVRLSDEQRIDWLRLIRTPNIGPRTFRSLLNHFGGARAALATLPSLARRGGASGAPQICPREDAVREIALAHKLGVTFVALNEPDYPARLQMIDDAPPLVAIRGNAAALARPMVAMVGSRNASGAGLKFTQMIARELGEAGFVVVSGLARGIDAAAHKGKPCDRDGRGACRRPRPHLSGRACEPDRGHPAGRRGVVGNAARLGAARQRLSAPQPADLRPFAWRRHRRGRQTLGLADHRALRARTGPRGLRRAGLAARPAVRRNQRPDQARRDPGDRNADIVSVLQPIMERHEWFVREPEHDMPPDDSAPADDERARIVALLGPAPVGIDDLVRMAHSSLAVVRTVLLELEIAGRLERQGGGLVSLV
jgi:DNA processing protein